MKVSLSVLYDYQTFHIQRFGGISRYFYEIAIRMKSVSPRLALKYSMNQYICDKRLGDYHAIPKRPFKLFEGVFRKLNRKASLKALTNGDIDIFHPTYYDPYFLPALHHDGKSIPFVLTIHDMTHERFPQYFSPNDPTIANKRLLAQKATRIIAISESTKRDVMELLDIPEEKIDVIYHGIVPNELATGCPKGLPEDYILYVGERRRYKNFERVIEAFGKLVKKHPTLYLVLTGRPFSKHETDAFIQHGIQDRVKVMSDISDKVLAQLYRNARLFVYPSLYEGFGIPILEAFTQHCPVVLSRASCFPEVAGDAAEYFEPNSVDGLVDALEKVLTDNAYRNELAERGKERLKLFTWDETARKTEETYRRALGSKE